MLNPEDDVNFELERVSYMFRCASTYNWYALNDYCSSFLIKYHGSALVMTRRNMLSSIRKELLFTDQWGNTVLHAACFQQPPLDVIEILLSMGRQTSILQELVSKQTRDGSTALLVACATGASFEVIQALLLLADTSHSPSITGHRTRPLFQQFINSSQKTVPDIKQSCQRPHETNTNNDEKIPLHSPSFSSKFCKSHLELCLPLLPDNCGSTPLSELCTEYHITRKSSVVKLSSIPPILDDISSLEEIESFPSLYIFWKKINLILQASVPIFNCNRFNKTSEGKFCAPVFDLTIDKNDPSFVVNGMASISHTCPTILSTLICKIYPKHLFSQRNKCTGLLPLHQAISFSVPLFYNKGIDVNGNNLILVSHDLQQRIFQRQQLDLVRKYAEIYPTSTRRAVPIIISTCDNDKICDEGATSNTITKGIEIYWRSPFCHAIMAGLTWNNYYLNNGKNSDVKETSVLQCIAKHAPESFNSRDMVTGLYPFMLAAIVNLKVAPDQTTGVKDDHHTMNDMASKDYQNLLDLAQLDNIFNLLLNSPQQLLACSSTPFEIS